RCGFPSRKRNNVATHTAERPSSAELRLNKGTEAAVKRTQSNEEKQPHPKAPNQTFSRRFNSRRQFLYQQYQGDGRSGGRSSRQRKSSPPKRWQIPLRQGLLN